MYVFYIDFLLRSTWYTFSSLSMNISKRNLIIIVLGLVVTVGIFTAFSFTPSEKESYTVLPSGIVDTRCYGIREAQGEAYSYDLMSVDFYEDGTVKALLDYKNQDVESSGVIEGIYSKTDSQIVGLYDVYTGSEIYTEERIIRFNESGLVFAFGEMYQDEDGTVRYVDTSAITFDYPLPMMSCQRYEVWREAFNKETNTTGIITTE